MSYIIDPNATLDYTFDWTNWLALNETITAHTVTATTGITVDSHTETAGIVTAWLSNGILDSDVKVTCHVTTSAGRQDERTLDIAVRER